MSSSTERGYSRTLGGYTNGGTLWARRSMEMDKRDRVGRFVKNSLVGMVDIDVNVWRICATGWFGIVCEQHGALLAFFSL